MASHKISVIVAVRNTAMFLQNCVNSILLQTYKDVEVILIDAFSSDGSSDICDVAKQKDKRLKVEHLYVQNLSMALNKGLEIADGDVVTFIDSNDYVHADMFSLMLTSMNAMGTDVMECAYREIKGVNCTMQPTVNKYAATIATCESYITKLTQWQQLNTVLGNKLFRRNIIGDFRFNQDEPDVAEHFTNDYIAKIKRIGIFDFPFYFYVNHGMRDANLPFTIDRISTLRAYITRYQILRVLYPLVSDTQLSSIVDWAFFFLNYISEQGFDTSYIIRTRLLTTLGELRNEIHDCKKIPERQKDILIKAFNDTQAFLHDHYR